MIHVQHFKTNWPDKSWRPVNGWSTLWERLEGRWLGYLVPGLSTVVILRQGSTRMSEVQGQAKHFHIDHNAPWLQQKLWITIVFDFSWDDCKTLENLETMVMQNSEGGNKVHYGLCESSDYKTGKACIKLSYVTDNLVPRSPRSCAGSKIGWLSNRTGTSVDDGARKSNYRLDQWQKKKTMRRALRRGHWNSLARDNL